MGSIYILLVYVAVFALGLTAPFALTLGYLWTDMFRPGWLVDAYLRGIPYSLLIGVAAILSYLLADRRAPPRVGLITILTVLFAVWVTLTCFWAVAPQSAWTKWEWAIKSVLFSAFIPFVIRSRNHIEAFIQIYVFSLAANLIPVAAKMIISGGSYGRVKSLFLRNQHLGQSEILSLCAAASVPLILYLMKHSRIVPQNPWTRFGYMGLAFTAVAAAIGTYARTGLVALAMLALTRLAYSRKRILAIVLCAAAGFAVLSFAPPAWIERMSTISRSEEERDSSALTRLAVWRWTIDFVRRNPLGGGFNAYVINEVVLSVNPETGEPRIQEGRAFHSSYFEVLGEQGFPGAALFAAMILLTFWSLRQVSRATRDRPHLLWCRDLAGALQSSLLVTMAGAAFTSMAFHGFFYYFFALAFCLQEYVRRSLNESVLLTPAPSPVAGAVFPAFGTLRRVPPPS